MFRRLLDLRVGKHGSSKQTGRDENRSARRYQRLHKETYICLEVVCKFIDAMTIILPHKQERQWLVPMPLRPNPNLRNLKVLR
jgi:hypothetical protein